MCVSHSTRRGRLGRLRRLPPSPRCRRKCPLRLPSGSWPFLLHDRRDRRYWCRQSCRCARQKMAENLLRSISDASSGLQDEPVSTAAQRRDSSNTSPQTAVRAKRAQVSAACLPCRQRKIKVRWAHMKGAVSFFLNDTPLVRRVPPMYSLHKKEDQLPV